jgi:hypothetical protein
MCTFTFAGGTKRLQKEELAQVTVWQSAESEPVSLTPLSNAMETVRAASSTTPLAAAQPGPRQCTMRAEKEPFGAIGESSYRSYRLSPRTLPVHEPAKVAHDGLGSVLRAAHFGG